MLTAAAADQWSPNKDEMKASSIFLSTGKLNNTKLIYISSSFLFSSFFILNQIILHRLLSIYFSLPVRLKKTHIISWIPIGVSTLWCVNAELQNASHEQQKNTFFQVPLLLLLTLFKFMFLALWDWASWGPIPCKATGIHSLKIKWKEHFFPFCGISLTYEEINREISLFFNQNPTVYLCLPAPK